MTIFSFHLAECGIPAAVRALSRAPNARSVAGLLHAETMTRMTLGAPIVSPARMQLRHLTMFAAWQSAAAIDDFLSQRPLGRVFASGWHVRMDLKRRWGHITEFDAFAQAPLESEEEGPVVAVTLARMKLPQVPRFLQWGRPVERLVRDHPGTTLSLAALRLPRTISTFSIWRSQSEMRDMVRGHSVVPAPERHAVAMRERQRKDFHFEFATYRFEPLSEHGAWEGRECFVPR